MAPPCSCTAPVTCLCRSACSRVVISEANGLSQPRLLGAYPPVTIRPTRPLERSPKYAASFDMFQKLSSRPVCIEPITSRLRSLIEPSCSGEKRWG